MDKVEELREFLQERLSNDDCWDMVEFITYGYRRNAAPIMWNGTPFQFIEQEGGGEGGAESCYTVLKHGDDYYKLSYYYRSYEGFNLDYMDVRLVTPKQKTITVYE